MIGIAIDKGADCMAKVRKAKTDEGMEWKGGCQ